MPAEAANGSRESNGSIDVDLRNLDLEGALSNRKSRESDRRRRRRKQKKNNRSAFRNGAFDDQSDADDAKENIDPQQDGEQIQVEYVPEKAELEDTLVEDFKKVFEKFSFSNDAAIAEVNDKKDETGQNSASNNKADSDSEEEEQDTQQKEKGLSNKKKKLQRRMKIAELKQICSRPDVVEVWDATASDPKLLVYLKSYRNTVPVPRHWSQKRKFLQGTSCNYHGGSTCQSKGPLESFSS